jgi:predicted HTH transcriptional regulator
MMFEHRPISEITDHDLINLLGDQEENLWIDFKQMQYHKDNTKTEERRHEICKDVTAMANAEGGYIVIGVQETDKIAQRFFDIPDAERKSESIYDICHQYIVPRIAKLEVIPRNLRWQNQAYNLIIIHIPFSEVRPMVLIRMVHSTL